LGPMALVPASVDPASAITPGRDNSPFLHSQVYRPTDLLSLHPDKFNVIVWQPRLGIVHA
ncbi:MAG: hypothetical protein ACRD2L_24315, partial [Terriglobia bacterium]